jgi:hypothetical protein
MQRKERKDNSTSVHLSNHHLQHGVSYFLPFGGDESTRGQRNRLVDKERISVAIERRKLRKDRRYERKLRKEV